MNIPTRTDFNRNYRFARSPSPLSDSASSVQSPSHPHTPTRQSRAPQSSPDSATPEIFRFSPDAEAITHGLARQHITSPRTPTRVAGIEAPSARSIGQSLLGSRQAPCPTQGHRGHKRSAPLNQLEFMRQVTATSDRFNRGVGLIVNQSPVEQSQGLLPPASFSSTQRHFLQTPYARPLIRPQRAPTGRSASHAISPLQLTSPLAGRARRPAASAPPTPPRT